MGCLMFTADPEPPLQSQMVLWAIAAVNRGFWLSVCGGVPLGGLRVTWCAWRPCATNRGWSYRRLLCVGAAQDKKRATALHWAARHNADEEVAELLLQHNADVNAQARDSTTPSLVVRHERYRSRVSDFGEEHHTAWVIRLLGSGAARLWLQLGQ